MPKHRLLIVEDDPNLGQILKEYLEIKGFEAQLARDGAEGLKVFEKDKFDCCLLDVMMPKKDGFTLAKEIRELDQDVPFVFLTAKSMQDDKIKGLKMGADDYITKPFSMEELMLRLQVILKRSKNNETQKSVFEVGNSVLDHARQTLTIDGQTVSLTSKEADLLMLLCQNENKITDRSAALKMIWGDDSYFNARSMDVYIAKLRKHLALDPDLNIVTVHGQGFRLVVDS